MLIGPPEGYNIRNLLWHGFLQPSELPRALVGVLLLLLPSLRAVVEHRLGFHPLQQPTEFDSWGRLVSLMKRRPIAPDARGQLGCEAASTVMEVETRAGARTVPEATAAAVADKEAMATAVADKEAIAAAAADKEVMAAAAADKAATAAAVADKEAVSLVQQIR